MSSSASTSFRTSFETADPQPRLQLPAFWQAEVLGGPEHLPAGKAGAGLTGTRSLRVQTGTPGRGLLFEGLSIEIAAGTELSYALCPVLEKDLGYRATWSAVDCRFDDGTWLSELSPADQHGFPATAIGQGEAKVLLVDHWNVVRVDLTVAAGRTVEALALTVARAPQDEPEIGTREATDPPAAVELWLDHLSLGPRTRQPATSLADRVDTRRGTHSSGKYSRGNTAPLTAVPNGFGFLVPLTDGASHSWMYSWAAHNGEDNRPRLHGVAVSHITSPWMGDRNQVAFHPAAAPADGSPPDASLQARGLAFDHAAETARPHRYQVPLDGGFHVSAVPTDHGGLVSLTYPPGAGEGVVLADLVSVQGAGADGPGELAFDDHGRLTGWIETGSRLSVGRSRMFVAGRLDRPVTTTGAAAGDRPHARYARIGLDESRQVQLRFATSFISLEQAWHTFGLEVAGRNAGQLEEAARGEWEERLAVVEVEGAGEEQLDTLYGNLYRLNLYPNSQWENAGSLAQPEPVHASPVLEPGASTSERTGAHVLPGEVYVNHGFWDTYRTCWPAYALLYPELAGRLADGFVQQYREGGWVSRWSSPGYADLMTGTSSDVSFADLLARGVVLPDPLGTYAAGMRNATAVPPGPNVGRKGLAGAAYRGWVPRESHESVSWSLEGYINDAGLAVMARLLARDAQDAVRRRRLLEEAAYLEQRAGGYVHLFDPGTGFFRARERDGSMAPGFDPEAWGGDYTESDAWNFAFHAPHDGAGLAALHGGPDRLAEALEAFFATPERADMPGGYRGVIHEMTEARDVRMGQLGQSNQVSHHIPYIWLAAGRPDRAQENVREILARLWTGSEIGQGYHGDEDNGEMSAWWLLSALGLYPLEIGTSRWALGSPLFPRAVIHHPQGDLVIEAPGNEPCTPYVRGVSIDGRPLAAPVAGHDALLGGRTLRFEMSAEPEEWGRDAALTFPGPPLRPWRDVSGAGGWQISGPAEGGEADLAALSDDDDAVAVSLPAITLEWAPEPQVPVAELLGYTVTSARDGRPVPRSWRVEALVRGTWRVADERSDEDFPWPGQLRPFLLEEPVAAEAVRLVLDAPGALAEIELLAT